MFLMGIPGYPFKGTPKGRALRFCGSLSKTSQPSVPPRIVGKRRQTPLLILAKGKHVEPALGQTFFKARFSSTRLGRFEQQMLTRLFHPHPLFTPGCFGKNRVLFATVFSAEVTGTRRDGRRRLPALEGPGADRRRAGLGAENAPGRENGMRGVFGGSPVFFFVF